MNTSHNKNLVIDEGWGNTIRNTLGLPENINILSANGITQYIPRWNQCTITEINDNDGATSKDPIAIISSKELETAPSNEALTRHSNLTSETLALCKSKETVNVLETENTINVPDIKPSTSKNEVISSQDTTLENIVKNLDSESDEDDLNLPISYHLVLGEEILSFMVKYLSDELSYLHYLKELSKFNELFTHDPNGVNNFRMTHITDCPTLKNSRIKCSSSEKRMRGRKRKDTNSKIRPKSRISLAKEESAAECGTICCFTRKLEIRKNLLERYQDYCCDEESFDSLITVIFDIEETLAGE